MRQEFRLSLGELIWAAAVVAVALGATELLYVLDRPLREHGAFAFFLAAVAIAAWRSGLLAGLIAVALSSLIIAWLMPPPNSFQVANHEDVVYLALFRFHGTGPADYLPSFCARTEPNVPLKKASGGSIWLDSAGVACWDANGKNHGTFWKSHNLPAVFQEIAKLISPAHYKVL